MPQRFLRPGITNSSLWNAVEPQTGNLFIRLLTLVDDFGRTDGRASVVLGNCFCVWNELNPKKQVKLQQVADMLQQLAAIQLIDLYDIDGKRVIQILQWQERIRGGCRPKWPERTELAQQVAASCSKLLPSTSPSPSTPAPTPYVIASTQLCWSKAEGWSGNTDSLISELKAAYPACDIPRALLDMEQWLKANPTKAYKTNWRRFVDNWLRRKQDRGGDVASHGLNGASKPRTLSFEERDRKIGQVRDLRNELWKKKQRENREFTPTEAETYGQLTKDLKELDICFSGGKT